MTALLLALGALSGCETRQAEGEATYLEVIGEHEQQMPEAGYRLNLSYNGPLDKRDQFVAWADSLKKTVPSMAKTNESIYLNYMPEQMGLPVTRAMYQTNVTYLLNAADSALYNRITNDLLRRNFPFNVNVLGAYLEPAQKTELQQQMMQKALDNAKTKLGYLSAPTNRTYQIVSMEELDSATPYGPEYYDYNRRLMMRIKVKARLQ